MSVVLRAAYAEEFTLLLTEELLEEVVRKATTKPALLRLIPSAFLEHALATMRRHGVTLPRLLHPPPARCRDPRDDYLLAYAESGDADYLVTYDEDLLVLDGHVPFHILPPPAFLAVLRERGLA